MESTHGQILISFFDHRRMKIFVSVEETQSTGRGNGMTESWNHRVVCDGKDFKNQVSTALT